MKSLASLILLAPLTTMLGIRFAQNKASLTGEPKNKVVGEQ
jgi:hypothetical protein